MERHDGRKREGGCGVEDEERRKSWLDNEALNSGLVNLSFGLLQSTAPLVFMNLSNWCLGAHSCSLCF